MKHLHADLSNLFSSKLPELPSVQLPSGPPYIRPMIISAINTLFCYTYSINWYDSTIGIEVAKLTTEYALKLSRPTFPSKLKNDIFGFRHYINTRYNNGNHSRYFRTLDDAYIDAFIKQPHTQKANPEFTRIRTTYPEYFI